MRDCINWVLVYCFTTGIILKKNERVMEGAERERGIWCHFEIFFFYGALCPQKPYGLLGTVEE